MFLERAYMAGLKPEEVRQSTFRVVCRMIRAYDKHMEGFTKNAKYISWHVVASMRGSNGMPSLEACLNGNQDEADSPDYISQRADFIREQYKKLGYLK